LLYLLLSFPLFSLFLVFFLSLSVGVDLQFKNSREAASRQSSQVVVEGNFVPSLTQISKHCHSDPGIIRNMFS